MQELAFKDGKADFSATQHTSVKATHFGNTIA